MLFKLIVCVTIITLLYSRGRAYMRGSLTHIDYYKSTYDIIRDQTDGIQTNSKPRRQDLFNFTIFNHSSHGNGEMEDYTLHSLLDIKENFDVAVQKFHKNEKHKVMLLFNRPGWENESDSNAKFATCEYNNCIQTSDRNVLNTADAIMFITSLAHMGTSPPIDRKHRNPDQVWIFKNIESPVHHWYTDYKSTAWHNTMNWSVSHRLDSDIPHPAGYLRTRTKPVSLDYESIYNKKTKTALWVVSNCNPQSARDQYVEELIKHGVDVDIVGQCGPQHSRLARDKLQELIPTYKFYLGFENSLCNDYITEKFHEKFSYNWIVVVRGGADYGRLLPNDAYINTADFQNISSLANHLISLGSDKERYLDFLRKKDKYEGRFEYGYRYMICEICRRLNNVSKFRNTYGNIQDFMENGQCRMPTDVKSKHQASRFRNYERVFANTSD